MCGDCKIIKGFSLICGRTTFTCKSPNVNFLKKIVLDDKGESMLFLGLYTDTSPACTFYIILFFVETYFAKIPKGRCFEKC